MRSRYGASTWHLAGHLAVLAIAAYALSLLLGGGTTARAVNIVAWLVAGAVLHDLVGLPLYSLADRGARWLTRRRPRLLNHLRVPAAIAAALLLVFFPLILVEADRAYLRASGHRVAGYARNWLAITAGLFLASAVAYAMREWRGRGRDPRPTDRDPTPPEDSSPAPPPEDPTPPPPEDPSPPPPQDPSPPPPTDRPGPPLRAEDPRPTATGRHSRCE